MSFGVDRKEQGDRQLLCTAADHGEWTFCQLALGTIIGTARIEERSEVVTCVFGRVRVIQEAMVERCIKDKLLCRNCPEVVCVPAHGYEEDRSVYSWCGEMTTI